MIQRADFTCRRPILASRPIVVTQPVTRLCGLSESLLDCLRNAQRLPFVREDAGVVINTKGQRVRSV